MSIILSFNISTVSEPSTSCVRVLPDKVTTKIRIFAVASLFESGDTEKNGIEAFHGLDHTQATLLLIQSSVRKLNGSCMIASAPCLRNPIVFRKSLPLIPVFCFILNQPMSCSARNGAYYRSDGVKIQHDPNAPGMKEHYGAPGQTDGEGFDPYADSVGPGIYGGWVKRDPSTGNIILGQQYQNHNPRPGPVYAGGGYTEINRALGSGEAAISALLDKDPSLVNEISTGASISNSELRRTRDLH